MSVMRADITTNDGSEVHVQQTADTTNVAVCNVLVRERFLWCGRILPMQN